MIKSSKIWPWSRIKELKIEISSLQKSVKDLSELTEDQHRENIELKKHLIDAADILSKKEEDFKTTIEFMKLSSLNK